MDGEQCSWEQHVELSNQKEFCVVLGMKYLWLWVVEYHLKASEDPV